MLARYLIVLAGLLFCQQSIAAEVIEHLQGNSFDSVSPDKAGLEIRMLRWSESDEFESVLTAYNAYLDSRDGKAFGKALQNLSIKGYLLTKESTGYIVYHAWQETSADGERKVLLLVPGLKSKNPLIWKQPTQNDTGFTLLEMHRNGDEWELKTSLDAEIIVDQENRLRLADYASASQFGVLR